eukprot:7941559-Pyramimonas_sp.AAC.1
MVDGTGRECEQAREARIGRGRRKLRSQRPRRARPYGRGSGPTGRPSLWCRSSRRTDSPQPAGRSL